MNATQNYFKICGHLLGATLKVVIPENGLHGNDQCDMSNIAYQACI